MKQNIAYLFLFLIGITGYIDEFNSVDEIAPHWLYLSFLTFLSAIYYLFNSTEVFELFKKSFLLKNFFLFLIVGLISIYFSINKIESIIILSRWGILFLIMVFLKVLLNDSKINFLTLCVVITVFTIYEVFRSISPYFHIIQDSDFSFRFSNSLKGVTGNKNITASSILIKVPFIYYLFQYYKNKYFKILLGVIIFSSVYNILLLSSRAMIICLILILAIISFKRINQGLNKLSFKQLLIDFLPFISAIILFISLYSSDETFSLDKRLASVNTSDESTSQRIRFYQHGIKHFVNNPVIGLGLGNWKIKSIDYDSQNIISYIVPYHMHNDFLEIACEIGIIGLIVYLLFFVYPLSKIFKSLSRNNFNSISYILLMSGLVYFIDSNLNFPMSRPISIVFFIIILSLLENLVDKHEI